jgi:hypothetical protein
MFAKLTIASAAILFAVTAALPANAQSRPAPSKPATQAHAQAHAQGQVAQPSKQPAKAPSSVPSKPAAKR